MNADLQALAESLDADPKDPLTIRALADWVEERGGAAAPVRELLLGDGDVLVIGVPEEHAYEAMRTYYEGLADAIRAYLAGRGREVHTIVAPASMTLRVLRAGEAPSRPG